MQDLLILRLMAVINGVLFTLEKYEYQRVCDILVTEKNVILVVYDRLSKIAHFIVTIEKILVEGLTRLFRNNM